MRSDLIFLVVPALLFADVQAEAVDLSFSGFADGRIIAPSGETSWLNGGLGKFTFGGNGGNARFVQAVGQGSLSLDDDLNVVAVARAEPNQPSGINALEAYLSWHPQSDDNLQWSAKVGAFFPTISLENDDLGWTSPYTLTPSAINSWIGDELRTLGGEAVIRWHTDVGTFSPMMALFCCNEPAGILIADRGWSMDDIPTGLFGRVPLPDATETLFHAAVPGSAGLFNQIDSRVGWYAGASWQMADIGKLSLVRYDNEADPASKTASDTSWATHFWSLGARTQFGSLVLIAQGITGNTMIVPRPGLVSLTNFQSAFLLASYDWDDWRLSGREDQFQTRHPAATPSPFSEDGHASTASLSWSGFDWLRLTGEVIAMDSRRGEYVQAGLGSPVQNATQFQLNARVFY